MNLSPQDTVLFYKLMNGLQFYVNQRLEVLDGVDSIEAYVALPRDQKFEVRDVLWEHPELIDDYVTQNPDALAHEELDIVKKWERFISGAFQIFRYLKKHTIFIGQDSQVYGVLGLQDSLKEMFYGRPLPIMVKAVLLPFKGWIIYDGVLYTYNIHFGGGIRSNLKEEYMTAKQNDRLITTLEQVGQAGPQKKPAQDWRPAVNEIVATTEKLRGGPAVPRSAFGLLRASAKLAQSAAYNPDDLDALWDLERRVRTALTRLQTVLNRVEE